MSRVPSNLRDVQQSFREVWAALDKVSGAKPTDWSGQRLSNVGDPQLPDDAVTKRHLDQELRGKTFERILEKAGGGGGGGAGEALWEKSVEGFLRPVDAENELTIQIARCEKFLIVNANSLWRTHWRFELQSATLCRFRDNAGAIFADFSSAAAPYSVTWTSGHFPNASDTYGFGSSTLRWKDLYMSSFWDVAGRAAPAVSASGQGRIYFDSTANVFKVSEHAGAYVNLIGSTLPVVDTTAIVKGSADATKLMRFEVDGFTTAVTRVLTPPDADITLAGINLAQIFSANQTFAANILASGSRDIGATTLGFLHLYATNVHGETIQIANPASSFGTFWNFELGAAGTLNLKDNAAAVYVSFRTAGPQTLWTASLLPQANNTYDIGSSGFRWATLYGVAGNLSGGVTIGGSVDITGNLMVGSNTSASRRLHVVGPVDFQVRIESASGAQTIELFETTTQKARWSSGSTLCMGVQNTSSVNHFGVNQTVADGETAGRVAKNIGGTVTFDQISVGATDSGGTGFRLLRVPN